MESQLPHEPQEPREPLEPGRETERSARSSSGGLPYAPGAAASPAPDRSISSLFRQLSRELGTLLRQESALARAEIRERLGKLGTGIASLGAGAALAFAGLLILLEAAVYALSAATGSPALSALLVGGAAAGVGAILLFLGRSRIKAEELVPKRSVESLRQDVEIVTGNGGADRRAQ